MRRITLIPVRTSRETKGRIAIVAACIVAIVAVFADHELRPDPDSKGLGWGLGGVSGTEASR